MNRHKETVRIDKEEAENPCASCNKTYKLKRHLKTPLHMKNGPKNIVNSIIMNIIDNIGTPINETNEKFTWNICESS